MLLLILWHVWKARNALIFDQNANSPIALLRKVLHDVDAWSCRYRKLRSEVRAWREWMEGCLT